MEPILGKHSVYPSLEESTSQRLAEASIQGVHPQVLDWHTGFPGRAALAATLGLAEAEPVGGVVAGAAETRSFDEGLEQQWAVCVDVLPVSGKQLGCLGQQHGGEVVHLYPRQDEKPGIVDDQVQVSAMLFMRSADVAIARCAHPGCGAEAEQGDGLPCRVDPVAQLRAGQRRVAKVMVALDVFVPEARVA
jgi:hypothetical protein